MRGAVMHGPGDVRIEERGNPVIEEPSDAISRHEGRQRLAHEYGATDIVEERGDDGVAAVKELTNGLGAHSVI